MPLPPTADVLHVQTQVVELLHVRQRHRHVEQFSFELREPTGVGFERLTRDKPRG